MTLRSRFKQCLWHRVRTIMIRLTWYVHQSWEFRDLRRLFESDSEWLMITLLNHMVPGSPFVATEILNETQMIQQFILLLRRPFQIHDCLLLLIRAQRLYKHSQILPSEKDVGQWIVCPIQPDKDLQLYSKLYFLIGVEHHRCIYGRSACFYLLANPLRICVPNERPPKNCICVKRCFDASLSRMLLSSS